MGMRISASTEYATRMLLQLARLKHGEALSAERLAVLENIPRAYVDQIFQRLRHAGLVDSQRGAHGGYHLARPASGITLGMMMRAVDGSVFEDVCEKYSSGEHQCCHTSGCDIRPVWRQLTSLVEDFLDRLTLEKLASPGAGVGGRIG